MSAVFLGSPSTRRRTRAHATPVRIAPANFSGAGASYSWSPLRPAQPPPGTHVRISETPMAVTSNKALNTRRGRPPMLPKRAGRPRAAAGRAHGGGDGEGEIGTDALAEALGEGRARRVRPRDTSTFLAKYFRDMATLDVLEPQQEFVAARELEHLETCVWQAILSWPPAVEPVLEVAETVLENSVAEFRPLRRAAADMRRAPTKATQA